MTTEQGLLFAIFAGVFAMLLWSRWRYDLVAFCALLLGAVLGLVPKEDIFSGFGHPATIVVALVLVVSRGLVVSGAVHLITRKLLASTMGVRRHIAVMGGVGALMSAFMNNVAALALLMPVDIQASAKAGRTARATLMPLSFATILGGLVTLIPDGRPDTASGTENFDLADYIAELHPTEGSPVIGKRVAELDEDAEAADAVIIGLVRDGKRLFGAARHDRIREDDVLLVEASPDAIEELRNALKLAFVEEKGGHDVAGEGMSMVEVVVPGGVASASAAAEHHSSRHFPAGQTDHHARAPRDDPAGRHPAASRAQQ